MGQAISYQRLPARANTYTCTKSDEYARDRKLQSRLRFVASFIHVICLQMQLAAQVAEKLSARNRHMRQMLHLWPRARGENPRIGIT